MSLGNTRSSIGHGHLSSTTVSCAYGQAPMRSLLNWSMGMQTHPGHEVKALGLGPLLLCPGPLESQGDVTHENAAAGGSQGTVDRQ